MLTCLDGCSIVLEIMRESLLKAGKRKEKKLVVRTGIRIGTETEIGTETGIEIEIGRETEIETETETEKKNVIVTTEIGTGIAVREGRGVEIEMRMMITTEAVTTRGSVTLLSTYIECSFSLLCFQIKLLLFNFFFLFGGRRGKLVSSEGIYSWGINELLWA